MPKRRLMLVASVAVLIVLCGCGLRAQTKLDWKTDPIKCEKYQHIDNSVAVLCNAMSPATRNETPVCHTYPQIVCVDDLHVVTEREWQEIVNHIREIEKRLCVNKAGILWDCKVAPPKAH